ncbi:MAG: hypothetical protein WCE69_10615 [Aestuariivirga sp.]
MKSISAFTARNERFISVAAWAADWTDGTWSEAFQGIMPARRWLVSWLA